MLEGMCEETALMFLLNITAAARDTLTLRVVLQTWLKPQLWNFAGKAGMKSESLILQQELFCCSIYWSRLFILAPVVARVKTPSPRNLADDQKYWNLWEHEGQIVSQHHTDSLQNCEEGLAVFKVRATSFSTKTL